MDVLIYIAVLCLIAVLPAVLGLLPRKSRSAMRSATSAESSR